ncbi:MAG: hypothetical protein ACO3EE_09615 [Flavobacteriales bacterium]
MINNLLLKSFALAALISSFTLTSCHSERDDEDDEFSSMDEFYNKNRQEEQEFIIDSTGSGPIVGKQGTKLWGGDTSIFMFPNGGYVSYPYTIKLIELYPESDFMEFPMSTVSNSTLTEAAGALRVRAFKNGTELVLKPNKKYYAEMTNANKLLQNMSVYYGDNKDSDVNWNKATDLLSGVVTNSSSYYLSVAQMGWVTAAKAHSSSAVTTVVKLEVEGSGTDNIAVFISAKDYFSVVKVSKLSSIAIPTGEDVRIVAMAMDQDKKYRLHFSNENVTSGMTIKLDMKEVTEQELLDKLASL